MKKIGFIGAGNMGFAILSSLSKVYDKDLLAFYDVSKERCSFVSDKINVATKTSNIEIAEFADFVVLAVKPQFLDGVLSELSSVSFSGKVVLSIVAGVPSSKIAQALNARVVRSMPNTPALIGEGMTGVAYDERIFDDDEISLIDKFYNSYGKYQKVNENLIDVVTCVSGSSPAYVYMFIEALADSAVKHGMPRKQAYDFAAQTVMGSAKLVMESKLHPAELKDMVCSPGGTTIAGVAALEEYGFRNSIIKATDACYDKSVSFAKK